MSDKTKLKISPNEIENYLGVKRFTSMMRDKKDMIGKQMALLGHLLVVKC